jgi:hypothetical protein
LSNSREDHPDVAVYFVGIGFLLDAFLEQRKGAGEISLLVNL